MAFSFPTHITPLFTQDNLTICYRRTWMQRSARGTLIGFQLPLEKKIPLQRPVRLDVELPSPLTFDQAIVTMFESDTSLDFDGTTIKLKRISSEHFLSEGVSKSKVQALLDEVNKAENLDSKEKILREALNLIRYFKTNTPLCQETLESLVELHSQIGKSALFKGNYAEAIFHIKKALEYLEKSNPQLNFDRLRLSFELGISYSKLKLYHSAIQYFGQALELAKALDDTEMCVWVLNELGMITWEIREDPSAIQFFNQALEAAEKFLSHSKDEQKMLSVSQLCYIAMTWIGNISCVKQDVQNAIVSYRSALALANKLFPMDNVERIEAERGLAHTEALLNSNFAETNEKLIADTKPKKRIPFTALKLMEAGTLSLYYRSATDTLLGMNGDQVVPVQFIPPAEPQTTYRSLKELLARCSVTLKDNQIVIQEDYNKILFLMRGAELAAETAMMKSDFAKGVLEFEKALELGEHLNPDSKFVQTQVKNIELAKDLWGKQQQFEDA